MVQPRPSPFVEVRVSGQFFLFVADHDVESPGGHLWAGPNFRPHLTQVPATMCLLYSSGDMFWKRLDIDFDEPDE